MNATSKIRLSSLGLILTVSVPASAEDFVLHVGQPLARAELLRSGVQRYLRYKVSDGHRSAIDIWERRITFERQGAKRLVRITQLWDEASEPGFTVRQESLFEQRTMRPIMHVRLRSKGGKTEVHAFEFHGSSVKGVADFPGNIDNSFAVTSDEGIYNFVADIEFFRQLPLAKGRTFIATLFDPPHDQPERFSFTVSGSSTVMGPDGVPVDCWLLTTDYNRPDKAITRFWIAKRNQFVLREESPQDDGTLLIKTLLSSESSDGRVRKI